MDKKLQDKRINEVMDIIHPGQLDREINKNIEYANNLKMKKKKKKIQKAKVYFPFFIKLAIILLYQLN